MGLLVQSWLQRGNPRALAYPLVLHRPPLSCLGRYRHQRYEPVRTDVRVLHHHEIQAAHCSICNHHQKDIFSHHQHLLVQSLHRHNAMAGGGRCVWRCSIRLHHLKILQEA